MYLHRTASILFFLLGLCAIPGVLRGQCDRTGWVAGTVAGCGLQLLDLDNGELLLAVSGADALSVGQTIRFSAEYLPASPACNSTGLPAVSLSCVSDTLPCAADFYEVVDDLNPLQYEFIADVYLSAQQQCHWDFGDGTAAMGAQAAHTFPQAGDFTVCLTVTDPFGCSAQSCKTVSVSDQNAGSCGYDLSLTAVGVTLFGALQPASDAAGELISVQWFDSKTNQVLAETANFSHNLADYGAYLICAQYQVKNADGELCSNTLCRQLRVSEPGCVMPELANGSSVCPGFFAPVCGCDGVTYGNECEAMNAGVTGWWAGVCGATGACQADFSWELLSGAPGSPYSVEFTNLASGDYTIAQIDFGDGSPIFEAAQWTAQTHQYPHGGIFRVRLTVWKTDGCVSSVTRLILTDAAHAAANWLPGDADYVLPGDANGDGRANVYDLLHLGVGYSHLGAPRPNASTDWTPQYAPNWTEATASGVNFKHLDCDGNGAVNALDTAAIRMHYQAIDTTAVVWNPSAPVVRLFFPQDTLFVNPNNPEPIEFSAHLLVGSPAKPATGLYGLALALKYPEFIDYEPTSDYFSESFFGAAEDILWLPQTIHNRRQLDLGFSQKNGNGVTGNGKIAKITFKADFIIIIDIADRSASGAIPLTIPIRGLKGVDAQGNKKDLSLAAVQDTLWIKLVQTTGTDEQSERQNAARVFPNPAQGAVSILTNQLAVEQIELISPLGQVLRHVPTNQHAGLHRLDLHGLPPGIYTLRLQTPKGPVEKKLAVR